MNLVPYLNFLKFYTFLDKPILLGGMAMQYYNLRKSGHDLDIMISKRDKDNFLKKGYKLNLFGGKTEVEIDATFTNIEGLDLDLVITLNQYDYEFLKRDSQSLEDNSDLLIISIENLLITKIFANHYSPLEKHEEDVKLIIKWIEKNKYPHLN